MKKAILFIACFATLVLTLSAYTDRAAAPVIGYRAPELSLTVADSTSTSLDYHKGGYVLVTFWSSSDAASRLRCNEYTAFAAKDERMVHLAVNFDSNAELFDEVVRRDNLTASMQYHVEGHHAESIKKEYHLERGLHTFMINPRGVIIAIDPDIEQVNNLLN